MILEWSLIISAVLGTVVSALIGWLASGELFIWRKFSASLLSAIVAGVVVAFGMQTQTLDFWSFVFAFLTGAGVDAVLNRSAGAVAAKAKEV